jgi:type II secretory pathway component PulF
MSLYRYEALDTAGQKVCGTIDAGTPAEARADLRQKGFHATAMGLAIAQAVKSTGELPRRSIGWKHFSGRRLDLLSGFSRQLALLLKAGLPLAQALIVLSDQIEDKRFREVVADLVVRVREGASLDEALSVHPQYFPELYICVARAGAASGHLCELLSELAAYYGRQKRLRDRVVSALTYPALMCCIGLVVLAFLMAFVVPKVTSVLMEQQRALPWPTEVLLFVSGVIVNWWWALAVALLLLVWSVRLAINTPSGARFFDRMVLRLPVVGDLFRKQAVARWADTMSNLLFSGIPVVQALALVKDSLANRVLAEDVARLEVAVVEGKDLSDALKDSVALPKGIGFMVGVGEESGELARVLRDVAVSYNEEVEIVAGRLTDLVNPILIVFLGVVVGFIVAAILLPITDFSQVQ